MKINTYKVLGTRHHFSPVIKGNVPRIALLENSIFVLHVKTGLCGAGFSIDMTLLVHVYSIYSVYIFL